jgi:putative oxygen-independent coproporphyrinogen III oxidase
MDPLPPLSLYIHFPWCVAKCPYCDFNSHSLRGDLPAKEYVDALLDDLGQVDGAVFERPLASIFMGGGTPSLFPPDEISRLLGTVAERFDFAPAIEITLEANPGGVEHAAFSGYRAAGINRLSIGVQSFADSKLRALGRIHDAAAARQAFAEARAAGFTNINLDLMFALPEQSLAQARSDIDAALELNPEHISYYHLTLEPNTVFYKQPPLLPDSDLAWDIQHAGAEQLCSAGFSNYEVSAWAKPGRECQHNLNYWRYGDYLGLGAGAHGKLSATDGRVERETRAAHPREYLRRLQSGGSPVTRSSVADQDRVFEFMLNALRLKDGFALVEFERQTGLPASNLAAGLREAKQKQLLVESPSGCWRPSERGWRFLDDLQGIFLPAD